MTDTVGFCIASRFSIVTKWQLVLWFSQHSLSTFHGWRTGPASGKSFYRRFWRPPWGLCCRAGLRGVEANRPGDGEKALKALMATWASTEAEGTVQK